VSSVVRRIRWSRQYSKSSALDVFWLLAAVALVLVAVALLMKRSVAEDGARVG
jgi:hypothetical protein